MVTKSKNDLDHNLKLNFASLTQECIFQAPSKVS